MYPSNMSKIEELRIYVNDRLRSAAVEILGVIEKTIADYEDQASYLRRKTDRQRNLLDDVLRQKLPENDQCQPAATATQLPESGLMCQPFPVGNPNRTSETLCAFSSREEFLKFASVGYCPYCCKATEASEIHLIKRHYLFAIHYTDRDVERFTVPCTCKERIKGRSHWHCPDCGKTIYRKNNFEMHLSKQHGHTLLQQSQDPEAFQASASYGEEDSPPDDWLWPEFSNLDQEEEEAPPAMPHIKEEQEPLWIGMEGGRDFQIPPKWPGRKPRGELEKLQVKKEEEERTQWSCEQEQEEQEEDKATGLNLKAFHQDFPLTSSSSSSFGNLQIELVGLDRGPFPATTSSPLVPDVDPHLGGESTGTMEVPAAWQQQQHQQHHIDCSLSESKDPAKEGQREGGGACSGLKTLQSKRANHARANCSPAALRWRLGGWRPGRCSPFQTTRGPHRCKLCGKTFYCVLTLLKHAQTHTQEAPGICVVCGKHLESREGLLHHLQTHKENFKTF